jgi:nucleoside 2-deoxyribosyltransferase
VTELRAYVSGALTGVEDLEGARELYEALGETARNAGYEPYVPHLLTDPVLHAHLPATQVYLRDYEAILNADAVVAWLGTPSLGVGAEIVLAIQAGKRVIGACSRGQEVSRFIVGLLEEAGSPIIEIDGLHDLGRIADTLNKARADGEYAPLDS